MAQVLLKAIQHPIAREAARAAFGAIAQVVVQRMNK